MCKNKVLGHLKMTVILSLIAIVFVVCLSCSLWKGNSISDSQYYTGEQIEEVFSSNEDQFTEVAKIILESDAFVEKIEYGGQESARVMSKTDSKYFTDEEWNIITEFFQIVKPLNITRYNAVRFGYTNGIAIHFPQNDEEKSVSLYYIKLRNLDDEIDTARLQLGPYDAFKRIGEHWWLGEVLDNDYSNGLNMDNSYYENGAFYKKAEVQESAGN